jgi:hypothetical protein
MRTLQTKTLYAKEKKSLAYVIGIINLILHGPADIMKEIAELDSESAEVLGNIKALL